MNTVYWIKTTEHTNAYSQGYVGISSAVHKRWTKHKNNPPNNHFKNAIQKHGWDSLIKQVIFTGSKEACLAFEKMLRPTKDIGWNAEPGGGMPPTFYGEDNPAKRLDVRIKISASKKGVLKSAEHKRKIGEVQLGKRVGTKNSNFKCAILATCVKTGDQRILVGQQEMREAGFQHSNIFHCLAGKLKTHKGHTFTRIDKE
jgi:predicted GIY-YIG superfamily endonuclease